MKTMLDLLVRLVEMRRCCEQVRTNTQLTDGEKAAAYCFTNLVRDCLPASVLETYDRLEGTELPLLGSAEVFSMAVIVATFRKSSPSERRRLLGHFTPAASSPGMEKPLFFDDRHWLTGPAPSRDSIWDVGNFERGMRPDSVKHDDPPTDRSDSE